MQFSNIYVMDCLPVDLPTPRAFQETTEYRYRVDRSVARPVTIGLL